MPQRDCLLPWRTALDNACLALENTGVPRTEARRRAAPLFARLGLAGAELLRPARLSSGMRQRVAFLRTLLAGKETLLLDEPFGALDAITRAELQEWLAAALVGEPRTVLLVTHDVEEALLLCERVVVPGRRTGCTRARRGHPARGDAARARDEPGLPRAARAGARGDRMSRLWPLTLLTAAVGVWELVVRAAHVPDYLVPAPSAIASTLGSDAGLLASATLVTLREVVLGYLLAVALALALAVLLHFSDALRRALLPILVLSQTVPTVVLAPVLAILLGYGITPKLVVVAIVCFFPIVVNTVDGLRSTDAELVQMMRTLHGSRLAIFRRVEVPGALPAVFSGARIAATYAAVGAVFGEWAGSSAGLGFVMLQAQPALLTARIFAAVLILCALALGLYAVVSLAERVLIPWQTEVVHA